MTEAKRESVQEMHRRFNGAASRVEVLQGLIRSRQVEGVECSHLVEMLAEAEAEKRTAHRHLAEAGLLKVLFARSA
jgi:hypothetical protein